MTKTELEAHDDAAAEQRQAMFRLMLVVIAGMFAAYALGVAKAVAVILAVVLMIMLHELGHFVTAKWGGMKVTEYFLGFGPKLWSVRKGETEYGVKALPLGGYVRIIGMHNLDEVPPEDEERTYRRQSYPKRLAVAVAGSFMHLVIAFVLLLVLHVAVGLPAEQPRIATISTLESGPSPAQQAGFEPGDRFVSVDGQPFESWDWLRDYIAARPGQEITFVVERDGEQLTLEVVPVDRRAVDIEGADAPRVTRPTGFVGIGPEVRVEKDGPLEGAATAFGDIGRLTTQTFQALGDLFSMEGLESYREQLTADRGPTRPSEDEPRLLSPVGLARIAGQAADNGIRQVLILLVSINIFVGIFNMFPMLPFDGGHVAIATYEAIRSKLSGRRHYVDVAKLMPVTYLVFLALMFLAVTALYLDVARPLNIQ